MLMYAIIILISSQRVYRKYIDSEDYISLARVLDLAQSKNLTDS